MAAKNIEKDKEVKEAIDRKITSILVVNNSKLKPFIELFEHNPENVLMKPLGTLFGFFKINDTSEDSSYIVNFLASILKKEYFANHKRSISDSFDAALKKVNLALSELAKQGNINWIGQLSGAVCVIEKNNFHFTVCGKSAILLLRDEMLSEISKDLAADLIEPNPLKTFVDVSSGKLMPKDKLIVTSEDIFNLFSISEIKKSALRFDEEKFNQFVRTALINELKVAGTIVIDVSEPSTESIEKPVKIKKKREENVNVFSEKTFREANRINISDLPVMNPKTATLKNEYVDKKTGHIYIQGDEQPAEKENESWQKFKNFMSNQFFNFKEKSKTSISRKFKKLKNWMIEKKEIEKIEISQMSKPKPMPEIVPEPIRKELTIEEYYQKPKEQKEEKNWASKVEILQQSFHSAFAGISKIPNALKTFFSKVTPNFGKIKDIFGKLTKRQKISSLVIIILIIVIPYIYVKFDENEPQPAEQPVQEVKQQTTGEILAGEKNLKNLNVQNVQLGEKISSVVSMKGKAFGVSSNKIISLETQKTYPTQDISNIKFAAAMDILSFIFLMDNTGKTISFSPVSSSMKPINIDVPNNIEIKNIATHSTYLYLIDATNNQIYRYPRAEGGFGAKSNWLKENVNLKEVQSLAVDDNLYLLKNNQILKFFMGKQENMQFEATKNEAQLSSIYTNDNTQNIYALDAKYGRIIKYAKTGEILGQYQNDQLKDSPNFSVDETNNKLYFISSDGTFSGELN